MLFCTSLIALVGAADQPSSSPRKLQIVNTKVRSLIQFDYLGLHVLTPQRQSMICELLFPSSILAVKMNRKTLVIVLKAKIYIYDISNMRLQHVIETTPNPEAIVALSPSADNSYLAYPSPVPLPAPVPISPQTPPARPSSSNAASGDVLLFSTKLFSQLPQIRVPSFGYGVSPAQRSCTSSGMAPAKRAYTRSILMSSDPTGSEQRARYGAHLQAWGRAQRW